MVRRARLPGEVAEKGNKAIGQGGRSKRELSRGNHQYQLINLGRDSSGWKEWYFQRGGPKPHGAEDNTSGEVPSGSQVRKKGNSFV